MGYEDIEDEVRVTYDYEQYQNRLDISIEDDPSGDAAANYDEYATFEAERSRLSGRENEIIDIDKSAHQEEPMKPNLFVEKMHNEEPVIENIAGQPMSVIKRTVLGNLLKKVVPIDYFKVCESLGWMQTQNKDGSDKPPLQKHYKVAIIDQLSSRVRTLGDMLLHVTCDDAHTRLINLLQRLAEIYGDTSKEEILIDMQITHQEIADMIGVCRQTVSTMMAKLKRTGIISANRKGIAIKSPTSLSKLIDLNLTTVAT